MRKNKVKNSVLTIGAITMLLTGCQTKVDNSAETEALKEQIARLEQQISDLEQKQSTENAASSDTTAPTGDQAQQFSGTEPADSTQPSTDGSSTENQTDVNSAQIQFGAGAADIQQPQNDTSVGGSHLPGHDQESYHNPSHSTVNGGAETPQGAPAAGQTTYTMEELSSMVDAFVQKAGAAVPSGTASQDMEQFFALKQEQKQIDDLLDHHEDELEYLYKTQSLTREDYKRLERELEMMEDELDAAEDRLEYAFGIDD
ncbi:MAG: hypothetical protein K2L86_16375 [Lachnospiraceae bacterium]|nr:hypothetical protein [Lachnospiraceae bacterium]